MYKVFGAPSSYIQNHIVRRIRKAGLDFECVVAFGLTKGDMESWDPIYEWLRDCNIEVFTFTPFSTDWRRYWGFKSKRDAALFKLKFAP